MMKIKLITIAFAFIGLNTVAQITVTDTDISGVGDVLYQAYDSNPGAVINVGIPGLNQTWDFSSLQESSTGSLLFISPLGTAYQNQYPNANLCVNDNSSFIYYDKTNSGYFMLGKGDTVFHSPALFYPLPLTYSLNVSDGPILVIDNVIADNYFFPGFLLSSYLPSSTVDLLSNGLANKADTALIKITNTTDFLVDASGTMTTPLGTFDVLRLKSIKYTNSELDIYCSDTLSGIGTWITNVPFSTIPTLGGFSNNEIEYKYEWITDDTSVVFLLAETIVDSVDNIINGVLFQTSIPASSIIDSKWEQFQVFPNPTSKDLMITTDLINCSYNLIDVKGSKLLCNAFNNSTIIDLSSYSSGTYFLQIYTEEGDAITKKVVVE
jgi:hypothetical protein